MKPPLGVLHSVQYPAEVAVDPGVHPGHSLRPAQPGPEADDPDEVPPVYPSVEVRAGSHQSTATVSNTRVLRQELL